MTRSFSPTLHIEIRLCLEATRSDTRVQSNDGQKSPIPALAARPGGVVSQPRLIRCGTERCPIGPGIVPEADEHQPQSVVSDRPAGPDDWCATHNCGLVRGRFRRLCVRPECLPGGRHRSPVTRRSHSPHWSLGAHCRHVPRIWRSHARHQPRCSSKWCDVRRCPPHLPN